MIVDSSVTKESLLAWDYESPITFPLPIGNKKFDIRIGQLLPRLIDVCMNTQNDKLKMTSGELIHALAVYMLGKSAAISNHRSNCIINSINNSESAQITRSSQRLESRIRWNFE
jgi:hypothetical protein